MIKNSFIIDKDQSGRSYDSNFENAKMRRRVALSIGIIIFIASVVSQCVSAWVTYQYMKFQNTAPNSENSSVGIITSSILIFLGILFLCCFMIGIIGTFFIIKLPLGPLTSMAALIDKLAEGDFSARFTPPCSTYKYKPYMTVFNSLNRLAEELENNEMFKSDFINNFSHEFKTPIVSISGFAKLLKKGNLSDEDREGYLDIIIEESNRLTNLSENVLNLSKLEKQTIQTNNSNFNFAELIRRDILMLEAKWSKKDISFDIDLDEITYHGDASLLSQICINLLDNAIKFSPKKGDINVTLKRSTDEKYTIILTVCDNGLGMNEYELSRMYDKFYQADHSHSTEGSGLGLTVVKRIVEMYSGKIEVSSAPNEGTCFKVSL